MAHGRRSFLKAAGITSAAVSAAPLGLLAPLPGDSTPGVALAAPAATLAPVMLLSLDGVVCPISAFEGGMPAGEVIEYRDGDDPPTRKMIGRPIFGDLTFDLPMSQLPSVGWEWIEAMLRGRPTRKNGAIILADFNYKERRRVDFQDALITEVKFPPLDASSKEAASLTLTLSIGSSEVVAGSGATTPGTSNAKQKLWHSANFRLKVGDLPTSRVSKVDAFTIKQGIIETDEGTGRTPVRVPGRLEFPDITLTIPDADYDDWANWFRAHVLDGENIEYEGAVEILLPDLKTVAWTLSFYGSGIYKLEPVPGNGNKASLNWVATMYTEQMALGSPPLSPG